VVAGATQLSRSPVVVAFSGVPGTGKSTLAELIAADIGAPVFGFDWLMGALTPFEGVQRAIQPDRDVFRAVGYALITQCVEKQLRSEQRAVVDCVARPPLIEDLRAMTNRYGVPLHVVECMCSDIDVHRSRIVGRVRAIPGWEELKWEWVENTLAVYEPLACEKLVLDTVAPVADSLARIRAYLER
jgi:adenylate kinase family enzyme